MFKLCQAPRLKAQHSINCVPASSSSTHLVTMLMYDEADALVQSFLSTDSA